MATAGTSKATMLESLQRSRRNMALGLSWVAVLLALLGGWVYAQFALAGEAWPPAFFILMVLAITAQASALLYLRALKADNDEAAVAVLLRRRRLLGFRLLGLSVVLIVFMVWLLVAEGLTAFPPFLSGVLLGLLGLVVGFTQLAPPGQGLTQETVLRALLAGRQAFTILLLVVGGILLLGGPTLIYFLDWRYILPEGGAAVLLGLTFLALGLWQLLSPPEQANLTQMRVLVLTLGGLSGLIIAVMTVVRVYVWREELLNEGIRSWQGEGAWRLWLCIYVELLGLGIMFGSLLLAQVDIRTNAVMRRLLYGYNALLTGLLLLAILVVLNILVYTSYPYTYDWRQTGGIYSLSERSKNLLESLKEPTHVYVVMSQHTFTFQDTRNLLENAQAYNGRLQVEYISPDKDPERYRMLASKYPKMQASRGVFGEGGRGLLLVYGLESDKRTPPYTFIAESQLSEEKMGMQQHKPSREFHGEDVLMTQLRFLVKHEEKPAVYLTQGRGEMDIRINEPLIDTVFGMDAGDGLLAERLKKDNYDVRGLRWGVPPKGATDTTTVYTKKAGDEPHTIPKDAKVIIIVLPRVLAAYPKDVLDTLKKYVDGGGKLIVLSNPSINFERRPFTYLPSGLEDFLKGYGVELGKDYVLRVPESTRGDNPLVCDASVPRRASNEIARSFRDKRFRMRLVRTVRPATGSSTFHADVILEINAETQPIMTSTEWDAIGDPMRYLIHLNTLRKLDGMLSAEPLPVAVAVSDQSQKPRLVVFGDATIAGNTRAELPVAYYDLLTSSMEWLAERPGNIGISPKTRSTFALSIPDISPVRMIFLPLGLTMLSVLALGTGVWLVRRR